MADPTPSAYYLGWSKYLEDPYHRVDNPNGIIQLGLAENRVSVITAYVLTSVFLLLVLVL